jgi:hypothetical protein
MPIQVIADVTDTELGQKTFTSQQIKKEKLKTRTNHHWHSGRDLRKKNLKSYLHILTTIYLPLL